MRDLIGFYIDLKVNLKEILFYKIAKVQMKILMNAV
jgi:hypothetical protein